MSNCCANSASVFSPLTAAKATFALKAGVWFRRGRLVMGSPVRHAYWPLSGKNSTYPDVQISRASSLSPRPPRRLYLRKLDGEARLIALACSPPPEGRARWTLRVLAERMVVLGHVETVSHETVRTTLQQTNSNHI